jgi:hypothetical protein
MMLEETTLTTIRNLAARLTPAERLELIRTIVDSAPAQPGQTNVLTEDVWRAQLADEAAYWYARPAAERTPYASQYVAVFKHTVVDHDPDRRTLYLRMRQRWPDSPVLLIEAAAQQPTEFTVLSPHLERASR